MDNENELLVWAKTDIKQKVDTGQEEGENSTDTRCVKLLGREVGYKTDYQGFELTFKVDDELNSNISLEIATVRIENNMGSWQVVVWDKEAILKDDGPSHKIVIEDSAANRKAKARQRMLLNEILKNAFGKELINHVIIFAVTADQKFHHLAYASSQLTCLPLAIDMDFVEQTQEKSQLAASKLLIQQLNELAYVPESDTQEYEIEDYNLLTNEWEFIGYKF